MADPAESAAYEADARMDLAKQVALDAEAVILAADRLANAVASFLAWIDTDGRPADSTLRAPLAAYRKARGNV